MLSSLFPAVSSSSALLFSISGSSTSLWLSSQIRSRRLGQIPKRVPLELLRTWKWTNLLMREILISLFFFSLGPVVDEHDEGWAVDGRHVAKDNGLKVIYHYTRWCWVLLALASLVLQATRTVDIGELHETILDKGELAITSLFDIEIIIRILAELPNWRSFFVHGNNLLDLILAIGSTIIQIPAIHQSEVYPWLTIFQL